jgi:hypothetical protein
MAQYPVEDDAGLYEAVNYLLSGPAGLGQNFSGSSSYKPVYLTGTFRQPYSVATTATSNPPSWYVAPVPISTVTQLNVVDGKTPYLEWTFTTPTATPPFNVGQTIRGDGTWDPSFYQGNDGVVVICSTTSVTTQYSSAVAWPTPINTYGSIFVSNDGIEVSTDANARVTVQGPTEIVFISSQLALTSGYTCTTSSSFSVNVQINRYVGSVDRAPGAIDYIFNYDKTVSEQSQTFTASAGTGTVNCGQNIFTTVLDQPSFGYYWYICEVLWSNISGDVQPTQQTAGLRSLTAQVIKQ